MNLEELTILARCNGLHTQTFRAGKSNKLESILKAKKIEFIDKNLNNHENMEGGCVHKCCGFPKKGCEKDANREIVKDSNCEKNPNTITSVCGSTYINYYNMDVFKTTIISCCKIPDQYMVINFGREELE